MSARNIFWSLISDFTLGVQHDEGEEEGHERRRQTHQQPQPLHKHSQQVGQAVHRFFISHLVSGPPPLIG